MTKDSPDTPCGVWLNSFSTSKPLASRQFAPAWEDIAKKDEKYSWHKQGRGFRLCTADWSLDEEVVPRFSLTAQKRIPEATMAALYDGGHVPRPKRQLLLK